MTPDGRYVAFVSEASNLVPGDTNGIPDIFVRDLQTGSTVLVSVGAVPRGLQDTAEAPDITPDGRYVAFYDSATNLVPGVPAGGDIYVRDLAANLTIWASSYARTAVPSNSVNCYNHALSADGRFVAYEASDSSAWQGNILRFSLATGFTDVVETNAEVLRANYQESRNLKITPDGRFIALVANTNSIDGSTTCIRLWGADTGGSILVSGDPDGVVTDASNSEWPSMDPTGRYVTFISSALGLVTNDVVGDFHLYFRDLEAGTTILLDADTNGVGSTSLSPGAVPGLSVDGRLVAFEYDDGSLVPSDRNRSSDIFVRDTSTGDIEVISAHHPTLGTVTPNGPSLISPNSISGDGRYVAFASEADNIVVGDTNDVRDVFVRDLATGSMKLVSAATNGLIADGVSTDGAISPDGRFVAFTSSADNLVAGDTNRKQDVFLRDLQVGSTVLVSVNTNGAGPGNYDSYDPMVSSNGLFVVFRSMASNLAPGTNYGVIENLFLRDMQAGATYKLTATGASVAPAAMTPDGRLIGYGDSTIFSGQGYVKVWDTRSRSVTYTGPFFNAVNGVALTPKGTRLVYSGGSIGSYLYAHDFTSGSNWIVSPISSGSTNLQSLRLSVNGRWLAGLQVSPYSGANKQVFLYDVLTGSSTPVSVNYISRQLANGVSDSVDISPDGRFIAYRSAATDLVPADINGVPDIFLYDRLTGANSLLTASRLTNLSADDRSLTPVFSGDGSLLLFTSWASDLIANDFNRNSDVFGYTFLTATIQSSGTAGQGPWISWPYVPGKNYRVQYKNGPNDSVWQDLPGSLTLTGNKASLQDTSAMWNQRFYRIVSY
jgi:hypothetical protein